MLRRFRLWSTARRVARSVGSPIAALVHWAVIRLGPRLVGNNLWLKHTYDYMTIYVDPRRIGRNVQVGAWRQESESALGHLGAWYRYGDGLKSVRTHVTRNFHGKFVTDGNWDSYMRPFEVLPVVSQLFDEGRGPRETDEYQAYLKRIELGQLTWTRGCRNQAELDSYYDKLVRAYRDIRDNGYRTQTELGEVGNDEIRVCIDRSGEICVYGGGTHRLSIAMYLDLDVVPVSLKRVHASWIDSITDADSAADETAVRRALDVIRVERDAHGPRDSAI